MISFSVLRQSKKSRARIGVLRTPHGEIETPALVAVATQASVKGLASEEAEAAKCGILIANTFHLHLKPGEKIVRGAGGLHAFMGWRRPLMTDSGGFQVFSLGFGHDLNVGKVVKFFPGKTKAVVDLGAQPKNVTIAEEGVRFKSPIDGKELFIGPKESIRIQEALGADIMFAFDECTPPLSTRAYVARALRRTHRWAAACLEARRTKQALFGIVQGSNSRAFRKESAQFIRSLGFDGYGIGGDLGATKQAMKNILDWTVPLLDPRLPRHLLGIGYLEDMPRIIRAGIDFFDCTAPTHYARRGIAFTSRGTLDLNRAEFLRDKSPLDSSCACGACRAYRRNYLCHLVRAKEITGMRLLTAHNLFFFHTFVEGLRTRIRKGLL